VHHIDGDRANNEKSNLYPTDRVGHRMASASLVQIGYQLIRVGKLKFEGGVYQWI